MWAKISPHGRGSVREVKKEIEVLDSNAHIQKWIKEHPYFFPIPTNEELKFITEIYKINHFQQNLEKKKLLHGGAFADPFVIASAKVNNALVVTQEKSKKNGTKIYVNTLKLNGQI